MNRSPPQWFDPLVVKRPRIHDTVASIAPDSPCIQGNDQIVIDMCVTKAPFILIIYRMSCPVCEDLMGTLQEALQRHVFAEEAPCTVIFYDTDMLGFTTTDEKGKLLPLFRAIDKDAGSVNTVPQIIGFRGGKFERFGGARTADNICAFFGKVAGKSMVAVQPRDIPVPPHHLEDDDNESGSESDEEEERGGNVSAFVPRGSTSADPPTVFDEETYSALCKKHHTRNAHSFIILYNEREPLEALWQRELVKQLLAKETEKGYALSINRMPTPDGVRFPLPALITRESTYVGKDALAFLRQLAAAK